MCIRDSFEAIHSIEVKEIKLESIEINIDSPRIVINEAKQAEVKYNPNDTTDDKDVYKRQVNYQIMIYLV